MTETDEIELGGEWVFYRHTEHNPDSRNILLLHGMSFSSADWEKHDIMNRISGMGFNVYAVDYPGYGKSKESGSYSMSAGDSMKCASFVSDFVEKTGKKMHCIVGPSMGGYIALSAISAFPGIAEKAILVAPAGLDRLRESLNNVRADTLIIWGTEDSVIPIENGKEMQKLIEKCELVEVEGAGHPVYLDRTGEFIRIVREFLKK